MTRRVSVGVLFLIIFIPVLVSSLFIRSRLPLVSDEYFHADQILRFIHGDKLINEGLMTYPGYHYILAGISKFAGVKDLSGIHIIVFLTNILVLPLFFITSQKLNKKTSYINTLLFAFFPILFPFFSLIYTDILSLFFILLSYFFAINRKPTMSGTAAGISVFIRQNNIIWLVFINCVMYVKNNGWRITPKKIRSHLFDSRLFIFAFGLAFYLIYFNHGLVMSDYAKSYIHFSLSLFNNVYFFLFLFSFLFLPEVIARIPQVILLIKRKPWILLFLVLFFPFFLNSFVNDHPFNHAPWFLHNLIMVTFTQTLISKIIFYGIISLSFVTLCTIRFREKYNYLLYPFTLIYLLPYWLVEQRYSLIPFMFLILLRKEWGMKIVTITLFYFLLWCFFFVQGITYRWFFL